ncbi:signal peptide peptidase-domain-containing protein [Podospora aff. communis PSN243]|uniref:Signal peptide peptidase-domain-containing protein n=1 Tax=Podospora aff. communis PSN243 TaxID=3040156 RepID=A0AAV9GF95_9PEZI|nr:signal peptide peptidase-domain-containing protein [Podospora aff. communis PSN243]
MSSEDANAVMAGDGNSSSAGGANVTVESSSSNSTQGPSSYRIIFSMLLKRDFLFVEAQVLLSALTIIWLGAHASLRRPPSAALAKPKGKGKKKLKDDQFTEGFAASDAIMLPILAGVVLIGLYYLIEWLQDPDILNKLLRVYFSIVSVASLGRLLADALNILTSFVFPDLWADSKGNIYRIDSYTRCQVQVREDDTESGEVSKTPFPGYLASVSFSPRTMHAAWEIRHLLTEEWTTRFAMHGLFFFKFNLKLNSLLGFFFAILVSIAYHMTAWHMLSNLLGSAFSYSAFSLMSPTSFAIGSMVLAGLFFYDIVMVFYTPFMITVAKKVDAPIKLVFPGSAGVSMLGLGDIIIPGLMMGLALRFDLYRYYQKKIKIESLDLVSEVASDVAGETTTATVTTYRRVKAPYIDPQSQWGNRLWTTKFGRLLPVPEAASVRGATAFPKPYFYASVVGYALGMLVTLAMVLVFNHGQPALLYLVPGVTGSVWLTAWIRGELKEMWEYTEDGSLDTEDVVVEVDANGEVVEGAEPSAKSDADKTNPERSEENGVKEPAAQGEDGDGYNVFLFSITAPRHRALADRALKRD